MQAEAILNVELHLLSKKSDSNYSKQNITETEIIRQTKVSSVHPSTFKCQQIIQICGTPPPPPQWIFMKKRRDNPPAALLITGNAELQFTLTPEALNWFHKHRCSDILENWFKIVPRSENSSSQTRSKMCLRRKWSPNSSSTPTGGVNAR